MDDEINPNWTSHPIVDRAMTRHGGLTVDALQCVLDTVDEIEDRFPGIGLGPFSTVDPMIPEEAARTLELHGVASDEIELITGVCPNPRTRALGRDGLNRTQRRMFDLADMDKNPREILAEYPNLGLGLGSVQRSTSLRNPLTDAQRAIVDLRSEGVKVDDIVDRLGVSKSAVQDALLRDQYHDSRGIHDYAAVPA